MAEIGALLSGLGEKMAKIPFISVDFTEYRQDFSPKD